MRLMCVGNISIKSLGSAAMMIKLACRKGLLGLDGISLNCFTCVLASSSYYVGFVDVGTLVSTNMMF